MQDTISSENKYRYAIEEELKWLEEDIRITEDCISGKETTQWPQAFLIQRLSDSRLELSRLQGFMRDFEEVHENKSL